jgi:transposase
MAGRKITRVEKKALEEGYVIGYIDESAFSHCPYVRRTYHLKGQRPVLVHGPLRGGVQAISMVTENGGLYFKIKRGSFKGEDVAAFLENLLHHFRRKKLLIIWDGASTHRSKEVKHFLSTKAKGRIHLEILPSHSPELNADEQAHGYIKQNRLANDLFLTVDQLEKAVITEYEWLKTQGWLIHNFFLHKDVAFYHTSTA